jgi:IS1 family transposase/transposase-like protein
MSIKINYNKIIEIIKIGLNIMNCPKCESSNIIKNGIARSGKQNYKCHSCQCQFVENPTHYHISQEKIDLIDRLLLERLSLAGIARAVPISESWLQDYVNDKYEKISKKVHVTSKKKGKMIIECDEMWSFVMYKANKVWIWLAIDYETREIVGAYIGKRDGAAAKALWDSLPAVYRQCAVCYTDFWDAYKQALPSKRHKAVGKETGLTNHIERFNNTVRQRVSRLVRKSLSFSKKIENHIGAIWLFIHHYNSSLLK